MSGKESNHLIQGNPRLSLYRAVNQKSTVLYLKNSVFPCKIDTLYLAPLKI